MSDPPQPNLWKSEDLWVAFNRRAVFDAVRGFSLFRRKTYWACRESGLGPAIHARSQPFPMRLIASPAC